MGNGVGLVVRRLRARQGEIERAVFARVREVVPDRAGDIDSEYVQGLRIAVAAAVEFGLTGLEHVEGAPAEIPTQAVAQARLAARSGVSLEAVLRRYIVGHALLWDYVMGEADRLERTGRASGLREMSRAQAALLDRLVIGVTREHVAELQRTGRSREQRLLERVRLLLAGGEGGERAGHDGEGAVAGAFDVELGYRLEGEHLGVIARGEGARDAVCELAGRLDRRLLSVTPGEGTVWAWLGGQRELRMSALQRHLSVVSSDRSVQVDVCLAAGEPARGPAGWRLTHRQAQAALVVAARRPRALLTRYGDVALLASALKDEALARTLLEVYLAPLEDSRDGGLVLRETLRAYFAAERNASSAAAALGVARSTVKNRLQTIEQRLDRALGSCLAQLEVALELDALDAPSLDG